VSAPQELRDQRRKRLEALARRLAESDAAREEGKSWRELLLVRLQDARLLVPAEGIAEVVRPVPVTPAPMGPSHLLGLASIHGQIWCMIELGRMLPLPPSNPESPHARFVLLRHPKMHLGFRVDAAEAMHAVAQDALRKGDASWQEAQAVIEGEAIAVLNLDAVFA